MNIKFTIVKPRIRGLLRGIINVFLILILLILCWFLIINISTIISHFDIPKGFIIIILVIGVLILFQIFQTITKKVVNKSDKVGILTLSQDSLRIDSNLNNIEVKCDEIGKVRYRQEMSGWSRYDVYAYRIRVFDIDNNVKYIGIIEASSDNKNLIKSMNELGLRTTVFK